MSSSSEKDIETEGNLSKAVTGYYFVNSVQDRHKLS
jgi:hypothetical protein